MQQYNTLLCRYRCGPSGSPAAVAQMLFFSRAFFCSLWVVLRVYHFREQMPRRCACVGRPGLHRNRGPRFPSRAARLAREPPSAARSLVRSVGCDFCFCFSFDKGQRLGCASLFYVISVISSNKALVYRKPGGRLNSRYLMPTGCASWCHAPAKHVRTDCDILG